MIYAESCTQKMSIGGAGSNCESLRCVHAIAAPKGIYELALFSTGHLGKIIKA